jgi:hypothetical protein
MKIGLSQRKGDISEIIPGNEWNCLPESGVVAERLSQ